MITNVDWASRRDVDECLEERKPAMCGFRFKSEVWVVNMVSNEFENQTSGSDSVRISLVDRNQSKLVIYITNESHAIEVKDE